MHRGTAAALAVSALLLLAATPAGAECEAAPCPEAGTNCAASCDGGNADATPTTTLAPPDEDDMGCSCWWGGAPGNAAALLLLPFAGILALRRRSRRR